MISLQLKNVASEPTEYVTMSYRKDNGVEEIIVLSYHTDGEEEPKDRWYYVSKEPIYFYMDEESLTHVISILDFMNDRCRLVNGEVKIVSETTLSTSTTLELQENL